MWTPSKAITGNKTSDGQPLANNVQSFLDLLLSLANSKQQTPSFTFLLEEAFPAATASDGGRDGPCRSGGTGDGMVQALAGESH